MSINHYAIRHTSHCPHIHPSYVKILFLRNSFSTGLFVTTVWRVLGLWKEATASRYSGQLQAVYIEQEVVDIQQETVHHPEDWA